MVHSTPHLCKISPIFRIKTSKAVIIIIIIIIIIIEIVLEAHK